MDELDAFTRGMNLMRQDKRAMEQMTLGELIDRLEELPSDKEVDGFCKPHSYRGYYVDLAFEGMYEKAVVEDVLSIAKGCMGEVFIGYKGGEYQMGRNTPVWIAVYGSCGRKLEGISDDGSLITEEEQYE